MIKNYFTVDVENWHDRLAFRKYNIKEDGSALKGVRIILELLKNNKAKATFFVLGKAAEETPEIVKEIHEAGCEVASHGYSHTELTKLNKDSFNKELKKTEKIIKKITGKKPVGFRAPKFSLNNKTKWAINILKKRNYKYDSSIFPVNIGLYGVNGISYPYRISSKNIVKEDPKSNLMEYPLLTNDFGFVKLPVKFRHLGYNYTVSAIKRMNKKGYPATFLLHSWEVLDKPKNNDKMPLLKEFVRNYGIPCFENINKLLMNLKWTIIK